MEPEQSALLRAAKTYITQECVVCRPLQYMYQLMKTASSPAMSHFQFWLERWSDNNAMLCRCSQYRYDSDICDAEMLLRLLLLSVHLTSGQVDGSPTALLCHLPRPFSSSISGLCGVYVFVVRLGKFCTVSLLCNRMRCEHWCVTEWVVNIDAIILLAGQSRAMLMSAHLNCNYKSLDHND